MTTKKTSKSAQNKNALFNKKNVHFSSAKLRGRGGLIDGLTPVQNEVFYLVTQKGLTPQQIAKRRNTKVRAVYSILEKLQKLGLIRKEIQQVHFFDTRSPPQVNFLEKKELKNRAEKIRLHGQQYRLNILESSPFYERVLTKCNTLTIGGETIRLHKNSVEVYSKEDFWGMEPKETTQEAEVYFNRLFRVLENDLKIVLVKDRSQNIKKCANHYAMTNNKIAQFHRTNLKENLRVKGEDGKTRLITDNSDGLDELEGIHPVTAQTDTEKIQTFYNEIMDGKSLNPSDVMACIYSLGNNVEKVQTQLHEIANAMNFLFQTNLANTNLKKPNTNNNGGYEEMLSSSMFM